MAWGTKKRERFRVASRAPAFSQRTETLFDHDALSRRTCHRRRRLSAGHNSCFVPRVQQAELESEGQKLIDLFRSRSEEDKALLPGLSLSEGRTFFFDNDYRLDLGGRPGPAVMVRSGPYQRR